MSASSMKWRYLGDLQLLSRAVAVRRWLIRKEWKCLPLRDMGFLKISCLFFCSLWSAIVATRICAESAVCLGPATVVGTGRVSVLQVYVLLSLVLKLDERTLVHRVNQLTRTLPLRAPAETVECTSGMVEDGGRERLCSGCKPKPVSVDQMHSTHGAQSPPAHETASNIVCGS